jgi:sarcosine oxidase delta subunit
MSSNMNIVPCPYCGKRVRKARHEDGHLYLDTPRKTFVVNSAGWAKIVDGWQTHSIRCRGQQTWRIAK